MSLRRSLCKPSRTNASAMSIRHQFDTSEGAKPILGDLVRAKRGRASRLAAGIESGVGGHIILSIENHHSAKQEEIDLLLSWVGHTASTCQAPPPIVERVFGRPRADGSSVQPILDDILEWISNGQPLAKYENLKYQISSKQAKALVTRYLRTSRDFAASFTAARAIGAHHLIDETIKIADDPNLNAAQAGNAIRARQYAAARANPEVYGNHTKSDVNVNVGFGDALEQLERRRQQNSLPAPTRLEVIDIEPLPLQKSMGQVDSSVALAND